MQDSRGVAPHGEMVKARNLQFGAILVTPNECGDKEPHRCDEQGGVILCCNSTSVMDIETQGVVGW